VKAVELLPIDAAGAVARDLGPLPQVLVDNCAATAGFYRVVGFEPPWIGYVAVHDGKPVGGGAFKGPPRGGVAEIAYYTLPELEGRGYATATARALVEVARAHDPAVRLIAQTLPAPNASNALLRKLGFTFAGPVLHPEDGEVWEWHLPR
jgi:ribosomal-protein-alanine N-acetyltransferase